MQIEQISKLALSIIEAQGLSSAETLTFQVIEKGGSGRIFVRIADANPDSNQSWVAMSYTDDRPDNARFASITDFLVGQDVAVPKIIGREESQGFLLVEDLGNIDLGHYENSDWQTVQKPAYEAALRAVFPLHQITEANPPHDLPELEFCFDSELYLWEQDYFYNHYVSRFENETALAFRSSATLLELREWLSGLPKSLVHRDFQSTNVMYHNNRCYLIDYQGMRFGLPEYDVASMVYDPYTHLTTEQREELITFYFQLKQEAGHPESYEEFRKVFDACAMQRLMQALGAYGFLGIEKNKEEFLEHIPPAKERLLRVAKSICPEMVLG